MCGFSMQNSHFWTRITNLYGYQTSPVVLCLQYSVISIRITCLYGSQPSSVVFEWKTATFGQELPVSMGPSLHLSFCACKTAWFAPEYQVYGSQPLSVVFAYKTATFGAELQVSMGPRHNLSFCAFKRACLAPELLVSMCPSPHLWVLQGIQHA